MKTYKITIRFITDYLQARFTDDAKIELENYVSRGIVKSDEESWKLLMHFDDRGIYVPNIQIRNSFVNAGRDFKYKKTRRSLQAWVISNIMVNPENIYFDKQEPDKVVKSFPARKDGNRVSIKHPAINKGTSIDFDIVSLDDDMEDKAIRSLVEMAGKMYGIGARRRDMFGRFEVISFKRET